MCNLREVRYRLARRWSLTWIESEGKRYREAWIGGTWELALSRKPVQVMDIFQKLWLCNPSPMRRATCCTGCCITFSEQPDDDDAMLKYSLRKER